MYIWIVYLHIVVIFIFLIQHAAEIWVAFKLREQKEPEGIFANYAFMPNNNVRNRRITYSLIIITGITAGFITTWWKQGWMWMTLGVMILIWGTIIIATEQPLFAIAPSRPYLLLYGRHLYHRCACAPR